MKGFTRRRRSGRKPFPTHLPRERVVVTPPTSCACCGSEKLSKIGEDITETLEVIPRQWKVIQTVREKFTCRHCEKISQPPAPFHPTPRGWAGPNLLAMILFEKYGQHQPLNRQRDRYAREGVDLSLSTLADQVGACTVALRPLHDLIASHVLAAERLHGDETPVPVLAKGKTDTGRAWAYVRDDRPFGGPDPPAALFRYSRNRSGDHPAEHLKTFAGILQADSFAGYNRLYAAGRSPGPVTEVLCFAHVRRKFYELADIAASKGRGKNAPPISPLALEAVKRIDLLFDIERGIKDETAEQRHTVRQELSAPALADLEAWMKAERARLSRHAPVAKAMDYNPRFLILPWIKIPNLGSHILAIVRRRLPQDWTERYNTTPVLIETFVQTPRYTGAVYRASGWIHVGTTKGRGRYDRDKLYDKPRKDVWLRPLRRDWKRTLNL